MGFSLVSFLSIRMISLRRLRYTLILFPQVGVLPAVANSAGANAPKGRAPHGFHDADVRGKAAPILDESQQLMGVRSRRTAPDTTG